MTPSSYKPPQINDKNRGLLRVAHQFVIKHPTGDTQAFINYIHGNNAEFHRRKEKHWRKDAIKALKFVQVAKQRGWRLPGSGCDNNNGDDGGDWYMDFSGGEYIEEPDYRSSLNEASLRRIRETAAAASGNHATPTSIATTGDVHDDLEPVDNGDDIASSSATPLPPPSKRRRRLRKSDEPAGAAAAVSSVERRSLATRLVDEMELEFSVPQLNSEALFKDLFHDELMALCRVAVAALSCPPSLVTEELQGCFVLGSPKSGKTTLVRAVAALSGMPLCELHLDWFAGKTAEAAAAMWQAVLSKATAAQPCLLLLHSVDRLSTVSEANKPLAACRRALLNCLPEFVGTRVLLIGESSSALTDMDDGLLCAFRKVVRLGLLDRRQRAACLSQLFASAGVRLLDCSGSDLLESCSLRTVGFNVGDLKQLVREAVEDAHVSLRLPHSGGGGVDGEDSGYQRIAKLMRDFGDSLSAAASPGTEPAALELDSARLQSAFDRVLPLAKQKPHFVRIPDVSWEDIGGCFEAKREIRQTFMSLVLDPEGAEAIGQKADGLLLVGEPGCGKTLLAKALSNEAGLNFMSVKGPEIFDKYLGESERALRVLFENARACQPCLVFFDEIDAVCAHRGSDTGAHSTVVNQLLTLLDGLECRGQVFVMAATNRPDLIDAAIRRPGRLGKTIVVRKPQSSAERLEVLAALTRTKPPFGDGVDRMSTLARIADDGRCRGLSGAELSQLVEEAKLNARLAGGRRYVTDEDFNVALAALSVKLAQATASRRRRLQLNGEDGNAANSGADAD
ncbi:hypothetical protein BOX15_Mlig011908g8 [Macrostomum lignano]|uniref:AAA+ ATPase domain-containing protein n=1 Tax=Macrostomum lignano TaxID=282301 RepID=A0A267GKC1_9PLAT|nr:hypothetical protein BOX15_Mlig011908g8 [Macrostomum lignano]